MIIIGVRNAKSRFLDIGKMSGSRVLMQPVLSICSFLMSSLPFTGYLKNTNENLQKILFSCNYSHNFTPKRNELRHYCCLSQLALYKQEQSVDIAKKPPVYHDRLKGLSTSKVAWEWFTMVEGWFVWANYCVQQYLILPASPMRGHGGHRRTCQLPTYFLLDFHQVQKESGRE
jgi:hypothetical protein